MTNDRFFYACLGVFVNKTGTRFGRNSQTGSEAPEDGLYLNGVQSVGVDSQFPANSLLDVGRFQQTKTYYSPQTFEINIQRVIEQTSDFFYNVDPSDYVSGLNGYKQTHIMAASNIGPCGEADSDSKSLKNYDISILYGSDDVDMLTDNTSNLNVITYRNCLVTNISYTISADDTTAVIENITLITRSADFSQIAESDFSDLPSSQESGNLIKRADVKWDLLSGNFSILPSEVETIFDTSDTLDGKKILGINNIQITAAINYSEISDVGKWRGTVDQGKQNLYRYVVLPVEVTCAFTGTLRRPYQRDLINTDTTFSMANGSTSSTDWSRANKKIRIVAEKFPSPPTSTYFVWDLGQHNYLTDISYTGGDTGGGNTQLSMTYQNDRSDFVLVKDTSVVSLYTKADFKF